MTHDTLVMQIYTKLVQLEDGTLIPSIDVDAFVTLTAGCDLDL